MKARGLHPCSQPCLTLFHPHFSFQHCSTLYHPHFSFLPSLDLVTALTQSCSGLVPPLHLNHCCCSYLHFAFVCVSYSVVSLIQVCTHLFYCVQLCNIFQLSLIKYLQKTSRQQYINSRCTFFLLKLRSESKRIWMKFKNETKHKQMWWIPSQVWVFCGQKFPYLYL